MARIDTTTCGKLRPKGGLSAKSFVALDWKSGVRARPMDWAQVFGMSPRNTPPLIRMDLCFLAEAAIPNSTVALLRFSGNLALAPTCDFAPSTLTIGPRFIKK